MSTKLATQNQSDSEKFLISDATTTDCFAHKGWLYKKVNSSAGSTKIVRIKYNVNVPKTIIREDFAILNQDVELKDSLVVDDNVYFIAKNNSDNKIIEIYKLNIMTKILLKVTDFNYSTTFSNHTLAVYNNILYLIGISTKVDGDYLYLNSYNMNNGTFNNYEVSKSKDSYQVNSVLYPENFLVGKQIGHNVYFSTNLFARYHIFDLSTMTFRDEVKNKANYYSLNFVSTEYNAVCENKGVFYSSNDGIISFIIADE